MEGEKRIETGFEARKPKIFNSKEESELLGSATKAKVKYNISKKGLGYIGFLGGIDVLRMVSLIPGIEKKLQVENFHTKSRIIELVYLAMRVVDDVVDGDAPKEILPEDRIKYIETRIQNLEAGTLDKKDPADMFLLKAIALSKKIDIDIRDLIRYMLQSMEFDAKRIEQFQKTGERQFFSKENIQKYFFDLDINGTVGGCLALLGEEPNEKNNAIIRPLSNASRIRYNLRDLGEDIEAGLVNITQEEAEEFNITQETLTQSLGVGNDLSRMPEEIQNWARDQIEIGKKLMDAYRSQVANEELTPFVRWVLRNMYEKPTQKYFDEWQKLLDK